MEQFHVIDTFIDCPHIKRTLYLPVWIRRVTGVMFFPVILPPSNGVPDDEPLGIAGLSLQNEKLNVVTNHQVFKKNAVFYESDDYSKGKGLIFLDRGYGYYDFIDCNDTILPNSYAIFNYTNRRNVKVINPTMEEKDNIEKLKSLIKKSVIFVDRETGLVRYGDVNSVNVFNDFIQINLVFKILTEEITQIQISKSELSKKIYYFSYFDSDTQTYKPFFPKKNEIELDYEEPFTMKIILRHEIE